MLSNNPVIRVGGFSPLTGLGVLTFVSYLLFCLMPVIVDLISDMKWRQMRAGVVRVEEKKIDKAEMEPERKAAWEESRVGLFAEDIG